MTQTYHFGMTCECLCEDKDAFAKMKEESLEEGSLSLEFNEFARDFLDLIKDTDYKPNLETGIGDLFVQINQDAGLPIQNMLNTYGDLYFKYGEYPIIFMADENGNVINRQVDSLIEEHMKEEG